jgi:histone H3/H4
MSGQASRADVEAVMSHAINLAEHYTRKTIYVGANVGFQTIVSDLGLREARAAISDLLTAVQPFAALLGNTTINDPVTEHTVTVRMSDVHALRLALARVGGAP